jgi:hypothetical protein
MDKAAMWSTTAILQYIFSVLYRSTPMDIVLVN